VESVSLLAVGFEMLAIKGNRLSGKFQAIKESSFERNISIHSHAVLYFVQISKATKCEIS
jgi:hypothetical protein